MRLEHVGIAVRDAASATKTLLRLFRRAAYKVESVPTQAVRTHFFGAGGTKIELLESLAPDSPIERFLERRGEGLHHIAFEVDDLDGELDRLRAAGFRPLSDAPVPGADGKQVFFLHPQDTHGVLVELCRRVDAPMETWSPLGTTGEPWICAGASGAPVLVVLSPDASLPGPLVEERLMAEFLLVKPAEASKGSVPPLSSVFPLLEGPFVTTLVCGMGTQAWAYDLGEQVGALGRIVLLDPAPGHRLASPAAVISGTQAPRTPPEYLVSRPGISAPHLLILPGSIGDIVRRHATLIADLILDASRSTAT